MRGTHSDSDSQGEYWSIRGQTSSVSPGFESVLEQGRTLKRVPSTQLANRCPLEQRKGYPQQQLSYIYIYIYMHLETWRQQLGTSTFNQALIPKRWGRGTPELLAFPLLSPPKPTQKGYRTSKEGHPLEPLTPTCAFQWGKRALLVTGFLKVDSLSRDRHLEVEFGLPSSCVVWEAAVPRRCSSLHLAGESPKATPRFGAATCASRLFVG